MEKETILIGSKDPKNELEYKELLRYLMDDLKLVKRKFILSLKYIKTGESLKHKDFLFDLKYRQRVIELFNNDDYASIIALPQKKFGGGQMSLTFRYTESGSIVGIQVDETSDDVYIRTPAKVYFDEATKEIMKYIQ